MHEGLQAAGFVKQTECVKLSQERQGYTNMYKKHRLLLFVQLPSARKSNKEEREAEFFPPSGFPLMLCFFYSLLLTTVFLTLPPLFRRLRLVTQFSASHLFYVIGQWQIVLGLFVWWHDCTLTSHNSACRPPQLLLTRSDQPPQCIRGKRRKNCCVSPDLHQY